MVTIKSVLREAKLDADPEAVALAMRAAGLPVTRNSRAEWCVRASAGPVRLWIYETAREIGPPEPGPEPRPAPVRRPRDDFKPAPAPLRIPEPPPVSSSGAK
jgi:hypothetical protein